MEPNQLAKPDMRTITRIERVIFGNKITDLPEDTTIIVDTRIDEEKVGFEIETKGKEVFCLPVLPNWEPIDEGAFMREVSYLRDKIGPEDICYIVDTTGASRSAMVAILLLHDWLKYSIEQAFNATEICFFEQNKHIEPKWRSVGLPRMVRHRSFAEWKIQTCGWKTFTTKHTNSVNGAQRRNRAARRAGNVRTASFPYKGISPSMKFPYLREFQHIRMNSPKTGDWTDLHPGRIGPLDFERETAYTERAPCQVFNLNNLVLACSVYPEHIDPETGGFTPRFFEIQQELIESNVVYLHHPDAKNDYDRYTEPLYYTWEGIKLNKVQFRVIVFTQLYAQKVQETDRYANLCELRASGMNLFLMDYDAIDHIEAGLSLRTIMLDPNMPWGHSMILYGLLTNDMPWEDPNLEL